MNTFINLAYPGATIERIEKKHTGWATQSELNYLESIGSSMDQNRCPERLTKVQLLSGYLAGARLRSDWDHIDGDVVLDHAKALLVQAVGVA